MLCRLYFGIRQLIFWNFFDVTFLSFLIKPFVNYNSSEKPSVDYEEVSNWYYHPKIKRKVKKYHIDQKHDSNVHVFFVHRTTLFSRFRWNSSLPKRAFLQTIKTSIYAPVSVFKEHCQVYAPKYRQATLYSFFDHKGNGERALNLAYSDVKNSFKHFIKNLPESHKIVLAGHSQGTFHIIRLIDDFFDNDSELREKLLIAYLVGYPVPKNRFLNIPVSNKKTDNQCFVSWSTFGENSYPKYFREAYDNSYSTNPVSWGKDSKKEEHLGSFSYDLTKKDVSMISVSKYRGVLQISKPKWYYPCLPNKDFVIMDYHLFIEDLKKNFIERLNHATQA